MSPDKTAELFRRFPRLYAERVLPDSKSRMCDSFVCGDGWFEILLGLSAKLEHAASNPVAFQVKEKFGELCFYLRDDEVDDPEVDDAVADAIEASTRTCETCGRPGIVRDLPPDFVWMYATCDEHGQSGKPVVWEVIGDSAGEAGHDRTPQGHDPSDCPFCDNGGGSES